MSENNAVVLEYMLDVFAIGIFAALIFGVNILAIGQYASDPDLIVGGYVIIAVSLCTPAAYGRYLMSYYWEDEEK